MAKGLQAVRGMNDILPERSCYWQLVEELLRRVANSYGYREIRFPIVEHTELFARTIGEVTDIVEKEMYTFADRNDDSLTLRPEGTAGCTRAGIEHGLLYNQIQRLWYMGPMFRHERPQKGRYRQFHQFGIEAYGLAGPDIDVEHILLIKRLWESLGIDAHVRLEINTLGSLECRERYHQALVAYLKEHFDELDEDSKRRLYTNPLRVLDSKNPELLTVIEQAPNILEYLDELSQQHFARLCHLLDIAAVDYEINPRLVRGLDYYSMTVYEWVTDKLGAQNAICAGGRYDGLVDQLGGKQTPAIGCAIGLERLIELVAEVHSFQDVPNVYVVVLGDQAAEDAIAVVEGLRNLLPELDIVVNCGGGSMKTQFKRADKSGADIALIMAEDELQQGQVAVKYLREEREQELVPMAELAKFLKQLGLR